jgi:hypothetical protein
VEVGVNERVLGHVDETKLVVDALAKDRDDLLEDGLDRSQGHVAERDIVGRASAPFGGRDPRQEVVDIEEELPRL